MIATFTRFDMVNFINPAKRLPAPLLLMIIVGVITPWPAVGIGAAAILMSLLAPNPFAADERGRLDTLYATLPITRRTVVLGRYLALALIYLVGAVIATLAAILIPLMEGKQVAWNALAPANGAGFLIFAISIAVQLPFFFTVGFTRARPMMYIPMVILAGGAWLASQLGLLDRVNLGSVTSVNPAFLWALAVTLAVIVLAASAALSSARYGRRAL